MITADHYGRFQAYLKVRQGRQVNPMLLTGKDVVWPGAIGANMKDFCKASPSELLKGAYLSFSIAWTASGACEITFFGF